MGIRLLLLLTLLAVALHIGYLDNKLKSGTPTYPNYVARSPSPHRKTKAPVHLELAGKRALVTGANGFFGVTLVEQLLLDGWEVIALHRKGADVATLKTFLDPYPLLSLVEGDVTDYQSLLRIIPEGLPVVFHVAAALSFWTPHNHIAYAANVLGTRNVANACLERNVQKLVHTSSGSVYDDVDSVYNTKPQRFAENRTKGARNTWVTYAHSKYLAEEEVLAAVQDGLWAVIMNPFYIVGKYDSRSLGQLVTAMAQGSLSAIPPAQGSFGHAGEIARAHITAARKGRNGESYFLAGNQTRPMRDLVHAMAKHGGLEDKLPSVVAPYWALALYATFCEYYSYWSGAVLPAPPLISSMLAFEISANANPDCTKARTELGYRDDYSVDELAKEMIGWLVDNNLINTVR